MLAMSIHNGIEDPEVVERGWVAGVIQGPSMRGWRATSRGRRAPVSRRRFRPKRRRGRCQAAVPVSSLAGARRHRPRDSRAVECGYANRGGCVRRRARMAGGVRGGTRVRWLQRARTGLPGMAHAQPQGACGGHLHRIRREAPAERGTLIVRRAALRRHPPTGCGVRSLRHAPRRNGGCVLQPRL
jgi:hypothetical protein